jgi:alpha-tubulin suppressor-like RCC1 family protein
VDEIFQAIQAFLKQHREDETKLNNESSSLSSISVEGKWICLYDHISLATEKKGIQGEEEKSSSSSSSSPSFSSNGFVPTISGRIPIFPILEHQKALLSNEKVILSIFAKEGYSFSSEYTLIYGGNFTSKRAYENAYAVLQKTLTALIPTIDQNQEKLEEYATFILNTVFWEYEVRLLLFQQYMVSFFPKIGKLGTLKNIDFSSVEVYVGMNELTEEIEFSIRFDDDLVLMDSVKYKKPDPNNLLKVISYYDYSCREEDRSAFDSLKEKIVKRQEKERLKAGFSGYFQGFLGTTNLSNSLGVDSQGGGIKGKKEMISKTLYESLLELLHESWKKSRVYILSYDLLTPSLSLTASTSTSTSIAEEPAADKAKEKKESSASLRLELESKVILPASNNSSFSSEVMVWGYDSYYSLGLGDSVRRKTIMSNDLDEEADEREQAETKEKSLILQNEIFEIRPLSSSLSRNIALERVKMISCSSRHTLLLTHFGSVYACGDNTDGALGHGDTMTKASFTLVDYFSSPDLTGKRGKITLIACGSGTLGCHSMAVDSNGSLYGWGFPKSVGTGNIQVCNVPIKITIPLLTNEAIEEEEEAEEERRRRETAGGGLQQASSTSFSSNKEDKVRMVACGDGFTVCLTASGFVFSWGQWSHGRLGLGSIPALKNTRSFLRASSASSGGTDVNKKLAKYQLKPTRVLGIEKAIGIATGEAHVLCVLSDHSLLAWGQNSLGQLGTGPIRQGMLRDAFSPVLVAPFISTQRKKAYHSMMGGKKDEEENSGGRSLFVKDPNAFYVSCLNDLSSSSTLQSSEEALTSTQCIAVKRVFCGAFHSFIIDTNNNVYSWGSRGSPCLGHNDSPLLGEWSGKVSVLFSIATIESEKMIPYELLSWVKTWSLPRRMAAFDELIHASSGSDDEIIDISGGDLHSMFLTKSGKLYLCGSEPVVSRFFPKNRINFEEDDDDDDDDEVETASKEAEDDEDEMDKAAVDGKKKAKVTGKKKETLKKTKKQEQQNRKKKEKKEKATVAAVKANNYSGEVVALPKLPSISWLKELCTRNIAYISSYGCRCFLLYDEERISTHLTHILYRKLISSSSSGTGSVASENDENYDTGYDDLSIDSSRYSDYYSSDRFLSILESRGKADCMVIASGHIFLCHKAILAIRSAELRNMIIMEGPIIPDGGRREGQGGVIGGGTAGSGLVQILLPELNKDSAKALFYYLYKDNLPHWSINNISTLSSLSKISKILSLPRLFLLCERFINLLSFSNTLNSKILVL